MHTHGIEFEVRKFDDQLLPELVKIIQANFNVRLTTRLHDVISHNLSNTYDVGSALIACYDNEKIVKVVVETSDFRELPAMLHDAGIGFYTRRLPNW